MGDREELSFAPGEAVEILNRDEGLTQQEKVVLEKLVSTWNEFLKLPYMHQNDTDEFRAATHSAQHLIMSRPTRRVLDGEKQNG